LHLEPQVFDLVVYLVQHRDRVVSKDDLLQAVWGGRIVSDSALTTRIKAARQALGDDGERQDLIRTFPRRGVRFVAEITEAPKGTDSRTAAASNAAGPGPSLALPDKPSIAVLPFVNIGGDPEQEHFAAGMVEEIITALCRVRWLFVIARNSSFTYMGQTVDIRRKAPAAVLRPADDFSCALPSLSPLSPLSECEVEVELSRILFSLSAPPAPEGPLEQRGEAGK